MPWQELSTMSLRREFVLLAMQSRANRRELCRRFGISPKTAYKWLHRYERGGLSALADASRRPQRSPRRTAEELEQAIVRLRQAHPAWGARKLRKRLEQLGEQQLPAASTVHAIVQRHGCVDPECSVQHRPWVRFEHTAPNALWQMDFKGHFALREGRCHPLTVLDDHSRFNLCLRACGNERGATVQGELTRTFRRYGLPLRVLMDNGPPWGDEAGSPYTPLTVWLMHVGVTVSHTRVRHPQTLGKDERFHRTLKAEVLAAAEFTDLSHAQRRFDRWREIYNFERPHEAIQMNTPASRYRPSARPFPETLPPIEYDPADTVRRVQSNGWLSYRGRMLHISQAFRGYPVALRAHPEHDGLLEVFFRHHRIAQLDLRCPD